MCRFSCRNFDTLEARLGWTHDASYVTCTNPYRTKYQEIKFPRFVEDLPYRDLFLINLSIGS